MKRLIPTLLLAAGCCMSAAATDDLLRLDIQARLDFQQDRRDGVIRDANSGFQGRYLNVTVDGEIVPGLTYSFKHCINKTQKDYNFFDATPWAYVDYKTGNWNFTVGKLVEALGGFEYDRSPIDLYSNSLFWNNFACYNLGVASQYHFAKGRQSVTAQITQSPFFSPGYNFINNGVATNRNMYGYNLLWKGGCPVSDGVKFNWLYSANLYEIQKGDYIPYVALGHQVKCDKVTLEADWMCRAADTKTIGNFFSKDMSVMTELAYRPCEAFRMFGKYTYDINRSGNNRDYVVLDGSRLNLAGVGVEYYPIKNHRKNLRLHLNAFYSWGKNTNAADVMQDKSLMLNSGITWYMDFTPIKRK